MKLNFAVAGEQVCLIEIWEAKVPNLARAIREVLPLESILQHGKLVGDLLFFPTPILAPWENVYMPVDFGPQRLKEKGKIAGAVSFYCPRQQISIVYGEDLAAEPLPVSSIGEVVEGHDQLAVVGNRCWLEPGEPVTLSLA
jgi:hypothetical protein